MKVALYYPWVYLTSGAERVCLELARSSRHEYTVFTNHFDPEHTFPGLRDLDLRELSRISVRRNVLTSAVNCWKILSQRLPLFGYDALVVCLCLTPLRAAFDPIYRQQALQSRGSLGRAVLRAGTALFTAVDRVAWRRYHSIICISEEVRRRVLAAHLAAAEKITVAYPGPCVTAREPSTVSEEFFLLPGRIMWTKNIELGIRAFQMLRAANPKAARFRLVIAGIVDHKSHAYLQRLREMAGPSSGIEFLIQPPDAELAGLYAKCRAVLFTAFNEDWGIVPLEAMAFGKPVIAVNRGGPRETVLDGITGFLEEPGVERFAMRMAEMVHEPQQALRLGRAGHERVTRFDWKVFADHVDRAVEAAQRDPQPAPVSRASFPRALKEANEYKMEGTKQ